MTETVSPVMEVVPTGSGQSLERFDAHLPPRGGFVSLKRSLTAVAFSRRMGAMIRVGREVVMRRKFRRVLGWGMLACLLPAGWGLSLSGCGGKGGAEAEPELAQPTSPIDGTLYFPMTEGSEWSYTKRQSLDEGEEEKSGQSFVAKTWEAPDGNPGCLLDDPGRGILNAFTMYYAKTSRGVVSYLGLFGIGKTKFDTPMLALPARIVAKDIWAWSGTTKGVPFKVVSKLQGLETVTVPAGTFPCIRIRHELDRGGWLVHWYAQDVGLVKADAFVPSHGGLPSSRHSFELEKYFISKK